MDTNTRPTHVLLLPPKIFRIRENLIYFYLFSTAMITATAVQAAATAPGNPLKWNLPLLIK